MTAVDVSPVGLRLAAEAARKAADEIETVVLDLEQEELPRGPFAVVTCFRYLQRDLFVPTRARLAPGAATSLQQGSLRPVGPGYPCRQPVRRPDPAGASEA